MRRAHGHLRVLQTYVAVMVVSYQFAICGSPSGETEP